MNTKMMGPDELLPPLLQYSRIRAHQARCHASERASSRVRRLGASAILHHSRPKDTELPDTLKARCGSSPTGDLHRPPPHLLPLTCAGMQGPKPRRPEGGRHRHIPMKSAGDSAQVRDEVRRGHGRGGSRGQLQRHLRLAIPLSATGAHPQHSEQTAGSAAAGLATSP